VRIRRCHDLDDITVAQLITQRHDAPVDFRAVRRQSDLRVNLKGEINRRRATRQLDDFAFRREAIDFVRIKIELQRIEKLATKPIDPELNDVKSAKTLDDWYAIAADAATGQPSPAMIEALYDDLNTAQTMAVLHGLRNAAASGGERERGEFAASLRLAGFLSMSAEDWKDRKQQASGIDAKQIDALISNRTAARARKDFRESDRIRDELAAMGVVIKDSKDGTTWEIAR